MREKIEIFNTMSMSKEMLEPIKDDTVTIYSCGPTVYDYFHIGNARAFLVFDVMRKYLKFAGYNVIYVQNVTDIEDKIINRAINEKKHYREIATKYSDAFYNDINKLGIEKADYNPKATDYVDRMINVIDNLVSKGFAYEVSGDVYFSVEKFKQYGKLSKKKLDQLQAGARITENINKKNAFDFTLWKKAKPNEPKWDSPWGEGRPGWHTECVVMSNHLLGETFDIHCGGVDLVFPHHENEIAQAEALSGKPLANYWVHNGFINIDGEKMAKSKGNFLTIRNILEKYSPDTIRLFFLSKHYRSPIDFSELYLEETKTAVNKLHDGVFSNLENFNQDFNFIFDDYSLDIIESFKKAMNNDFNTASAISILFDVLKKINLASIKQKQEYSYLLYKLGSVLGFFQTNNLIVKKETQKEDEKLVDIIVNCRAELKQQKNWALADRLRDELNENGIVLYDKPEGTSWKKIN